MEIGNPLNPTDFDNVLAPMFFVGLGVSSGASEPWASEAETGGAFEDALVLRIGEPLPAIDPDTSIPDVRVNELTLDVRPTRLATGYSSLDLYAAHEGNGELINRLTANATGPVVSARDHATPVQVARAPTSEIVRLPTVETAPAEKVARRASHHQLLIGEAVLPLPASDRHAVVVMDDVNPSTPIDRPKLIGTAELINRPELFTTTSASRPTVEEPAIDAAVAATSAGIVNNSPAPLVTADHAISSPMENRRASPPANGQVVDVLTPTPTDGVAFLSADEPLVLTVPWSASEAFRFSTIDETFVENSALSNGHLQSLTRDVIRSIPQAHVDVTSATADVATSSPNDRPTPDVAFDVQGQPERLVRIHTNDPRVQEPPPPTKVAPTSNARGTAAPFVSSSDGNAAIFAIRSSYAVPDGNRQPVASSLHISTEPAADNSARTFLEQTAPSRARDTVRLSGVGAKSVEQVAVADAQKQTPTGDTVQPIHQPNGSLTFADDNVSARTPNNRAQPDITTDLIERSSTAAHVSTNATMVLERPTRISSSITMTAEESELVRNPPRSNNPVPARAASVPTDPDPNPDQFAAGHTHVVTIQSEIVVARTDVVSGQFEVAAFQEAVFPADVGAVVARVDSPGQATVTTNQSSVRHISAEVAEVVVAPADVVPVEAASLFARADRTPVQAQFAAHQADIASLPTAVAEVIVARANVVPAEAEVSVSLVSVIPTQAKPAESPADIPSEGIFNVKAATYDGLPRPSKSPEKRSSTALDGDRATIEDASSAPAEVLPGPRPGATDLGREVSHLSTLQHASKPILPQSVFADMVEVEVQPGSRDLTIDQPIAAASTFEESSQARRTNGSPGSVETTRSLPRQLADHIVSARREVSNRSTRIEVTLDPPQLGRVAIEISNAHDQLSARILVAEPAALQSITANLPTLLESLADAGVTVDEFQFGHFQDTQTSSREADGKQFATELSSSPPDDGDQAGQTRAATSFGVDIMA